MCRPTQRGAWGVCPETVRAVANGIKWGVSNEPGWIEVGCLLPDKDDVRILREQYVWVAASNVDS